MSQKEGSQPLRPRMYVKVPPDRLGVVIGTKGEVKKELMEKTETIITIDTENGIVVVEGESSKTSPINVMKATEVIKAIAYGFSPDKAFELLDEDKILVIVDLKNIVGDSPNHLTRIKGRIIGEKGRARRTIEEMTGVNMVVGDTYVAIIGDYERAMIAKEAVEMLAEGRMHSTVYKRVDRLMRDIRRKERLRLWEDRGQSSSL